MTTTAATVEHVNPEGLLHNPAFTEVVTVSGPVRTIYHHHGGHCVGPGQPRVPRRDRRRGGGAAVGPGG